MVEERRQRWCLFGADGCKQWGNTGYDETSLLSGQPNDHKGETTEKNMSIRVIFATSRSFLRLLLSFVSSQVCTTSSFLFHFLPLLTRARNWLAATCCGARDSALLFQRLSSCLENSDPENSSEFCIYTDKASKQAFEFSWSEQRSHHLGLFFLPQSRPEFKRHAESEFFGSELFNRLSSG